MFGLRGLSGAWGPQLEEKISGGTGPPWVKNCPSGCCRFDVEEAVAQRGLVLVDRTLRERGRQRHTNRHFFGSRFQRRFAANHAAVEFVEVLEVDQRPSIGSRAFVEQQLPRFFRGGLRRAMHEAHMIEGTRTGLPDT